VKQIIDGLLTSQPFRINQQTQKSKTHKTMTSTYTDSKKIRCN